MNDWDADTMATTVRNCVEPGCKCGAGLIGDGTQHPLRAQRRYDRFSGWGLDDTALDQTRRCNTRSAAARAPSINPPCPASLSLPATCSQSGKAGTAATGKPYLG